MAQRLNVLAALQKTGIQFPVSISGASQLPAAPAPGHLTPLKVPSEGTHIDVYIHMCMHTHAHTVVVNTSRLWSLSTLPTRRNTYEKQNLSWITVKRSLS